MAEKREPAGFEVGDGAAEALAGDGAETVELAAHAVTVDLLKDAVQGDEWRHY